MPSDIVGVRFPNSDKAALAEVEERLQLDRSEALRVSVHVTLQVLRERETEQKNKVNQQPAS